MIRGFYKVHLYILHKNVDTSNCIVIEYIVKKYLSKSCSKYDIKFKFCKAIISKPIFKRRLIWCLRIRKPDHYVITQNNISKND